MLISAKIFISVQPVYSFMENFVPEERQFLRCCLNKQKRKFCPVIWQDGPEGKPRYGSTLFMTSVLDGSGWLTPLYPRERNQEHNLYPFSVHVVTFTFHNQLMHLLIKNTFTVHI